MHICLTTIPLYLSYYTFAGTSMSLGKFLVSSSVTRTHRKQLGSVLYGAAHSRIFVPVRVPWDIHLEGMTQYKKKCIQLKCCLQRYDTRNCAFLVQHHRVFYSQNHSRKHFPKCVRFLSSTSDVWEAAVQKLQVPIAGLPDQASIPPYITK